MSASLKGSFAAMENGGSIPQASDLLANHSISELRNLVQSLQSDCGSKKTELQMMVGSKYHDFIESADAIASMHEAADAVGRDIAALSALGKEVIDKSLALLDAKVPQSVVNSIAQSAYHKADLTATKFWECLNNCDTFSAAELLISNGVLASLLSGDGTMASIWVANKLSQNSETWKRFKQFALADGQDAEPLFQSPHSMAALRQVLVEDGYFLLLLANERDVRLSRPAGHLCIERTPIGPQLSPRLIAEAMTALVAVREFHAGDSPAEVQLQREGGSVFSSALDPSMLAASYASFMAAGRSIADSPSRSRQPNTSRSDIAIDMLKLYLDGVTERVFAAVAGMTDAHASAHTEESHDQWSLHVHKLLNAIDVVQRAILDVYLIFFHQQPIANANGNSNSEQKTLIESCCAELAGGIVNRLTALLAESCADDSAASAQDFLTLRPSGHPLHTASGVVRSDDTRRRLHEVWSQWMFGRRAQMPDATQENSLTLYESMAAKGGATAVLSNACVFCLQLIKSSPSTGGDVSVLQNKVRAACASAEVVEALENVEEYGFVPAATKTRSEGRAATSLPSMKSRNLQRTQRSYSNAGLGSGDALAFNEPGDSAAAKDTEQDSNLVAWRARLWQDANKTLLLSYKASAPPVTAHKPAASKQLDHAPERPNAAPMNLLWSRVFRKPFLHQVESALHASSVSGLYRVQQRLLRALFCVGVVVNLSASPKVAGLESGGDEAAVDYTVTVRPVAAPNAHRAHGSALPNKAEPVRTTSVHVFHLAEELRASLSQELMELRTGIQLSEDGCEGDGGAPGSTTDKESSQTLARSVQTYSCQLIGQVVTLIRCVAEVCRDTARTSSRIAPAAPATVDVDYTAVWDSAVSDALLLLGRFSWLMKVNGAFLAASMAFSAPDAGRGLARHSSGVIADDIDEEGGDRHHGEPTYCTSYDQLQSAFDIADSDGDGLITYLEAIEALQALCVGDEGAGDRQAQQDALAQCLWPAPDTALSNCGNRAGAHASAERVITSSPYGGSARICSVLPSDIIRYSLVEFKLLCGKYIPVSAQAASSFRILCAALDGNIHLTHSSWVGAVIGRAEPALKASLSAVYARDGYASAAAAVKDTWAQHAIEGDGEEEGSSIVLPSVPSAPVRAYLRSLIGHVNVKMTSVDAFQVFFPSRHAVEADPNSNVDDDEDLAAVVGCLAEYVSLEVVSSAVISLAKVFSDLVKALQRMHSAGAGLDGDDTLMLQLLFDLLVVRSTLSVPPGGGNISEGFAAARSTMEKCIDQCQDSIDPITTHLGLPILEASVAAYCSKRRLLSSFPVLEQGAVVSDAGNKADPPRQVFVSNASSNLDAPSGTIKPAAKEEKQQRFGLFPLPSMSASSGYRPTAALDDDSDLPASKPAASRGRSKEPAPVLTSTSSSTGGAGASMLTGLSGLTSYLTRSANSTSNLASSK